MFYVRLWHTDWLGFDVGKNAEFHLCDSLEDAQRLERELVHKHTDPEDLFALSIQSEVKPYATSEFAYLDLVTEKNAAANDVSFQHSQQLTAEMGDFIASHLGQSRADLLAQFISGRKLTGILMMALGDAERYGVGLALPVSEAHDRIFEEFRLLDVSGRDIDDEVVERFINLIAEIIE